VQKIRGKRENGGILKMKKNTEKQTGDRGKTGAGAPPKGVFKRIADAERQSGVTRIVRHTQPENLK
jgi:hypothetical protein